MVNERIKERDFSITNVQREKKNLKSKEAKNKGLREFSLNQTMMNVI